MRQHVYHFDGPSAFRRPLADDERATLEQVHSDALADGASFAEALGMVVVVLLQSAQFLYLAEIGTGDGDVRRLTAYEVATRLSILFWDSIPDDGLLEAAESGSLETNEDVAVQAVDCFRTPAAKMDCVASFGNGCMCMRSTQTTVMHVVRGLQPPSRVVDERSI